MKNLSNEDKIIKKIKTYKTLNNPKNLRNYEEIEEENKIEKVQEENRIILNSLIDFYLQFSTVYDKLEYDREREKLQNLTPNLIFEYIKSRIFQLQDENFELRNKADKKVSSSKHINDAVNKVKDEEEIEIKRLYDENAMLKSKIKELRGSLDITQQKLEDLERDKNEMADKTKAIILDTQYDNNKMLELIDEKNMELGTIRQMLKERNITIEGLNDKIRELTKMELKVKLLESKYVVDMSQVNVQYSKELANVNSELKNHSKTLAMNSFYQDKIKYLESELKTMRDKLKHIQEYEQKLIRTQEIASKREMESVRSAVEINKLKAKLIEREKTVEKLKLTSDKAQKQLQNMKIKLQAEELRTLKDKNDVQSNPFLLDTYKKKIDEKNTLINEMTKRFKKMNLNEKKGVIKQKEFEMMRFEYEKQILDLKKNMNDKKRGKSQNESSESSYDEYENNNDLYLKTPLKNAKSVPAFKDTVKFSNIVNASEIKESLMSESKRDMGGGRFGSVGKLGSSRQKNYVRSPKTGF